MATPPTIDYGRPEPQKKISPVTVIVLVAIIGLLLVAIITPTGRSPRYANQVKCASNLRQIGQAIFLYAQDNAGHYPPDLQAVFSTQPIATEVATCPSTSDQKASTPAGLGQPSCCSYVYVGAGLSGQPDPECVVVIEDPADHDLKGCNVAYADGHVDWVILPTAMQTLNDLAAGKNPPSASTTLTQPAAEKDYERNWKSRMPKLKTGVWRIPATQATTKPER